MCRGIPGKILSIRGEDPATRTGRVGFGGVVKEVCLDLVPEAGVGDYVVVHVGFAISRVDEEEARRTYELLESLGPSEKEGG